MKDWTYRPAADHGLPPEERLRSLQRESGTTESIVQVVWWTAIRTYLKFVHRLSVRGLENLPPQAPFILVGNHASHLDALVLGSVLPWKLRDRMFTLAAGDTFFESLPIATFAAYAMNALPIWRKKFDVRDIEPLRRRLIEGPCGYILFPEGTRTRTGEISRFKRGIGMLSAGTDAAIVPCHLRGAFEALPPGRPLPRPVRMTLSIGPPLRFPDIANDADGWSVVAARLEAAVRGLAVGNVIGHNSR